MGLRGRMLALLALALLSAPLRAADPDPLADIQQIQQMADAIKAQAQACAKMKCPECDCASLAKMMQALVDAETVMDALHNALIDANADLRKHYFDLAANSHLTGVKLAQLQWSLGLQVSFHKFGANLLKIESLLDTLRKIDSGQIDIHGESGATQIFDGLDSLANAIKNEIDLSKEFEDAVSSGPAAPPSELKDALNTNWDMKSNQIDVAKVARDVFDSYQKVAKYEKAGGGDKAKAALKGLANSRNLLTLIGRHAKEYSEKLIKAEKAVLKELEATTGPEEQAMIRAFQEWQRVREQMYAAEEALAAIRAARDALAACMAKAGCRSQTLSRPTLGPFATYGVALPALSAKLPAIAAALKGGISVKDKCPEPGETTPPPPPEKPGTSPVTPLPPPKHIVENNCPKCSGIALDLARTLDERDFVVAELTRIRQNLEKAKDLEKDAKILRDAVQRITELIIDLRQGKKGKNALISVGNAIFDTLGKPHTEITIENLEREKRDRQNQLQTLEEKMKALRAEEGKLPQLEKDNLRLFELSETLRKDLAECQKSCVPPPPPKMTKCATEKFEFDHWNEKQQKYPSDANKNQREAKLKKLCECLKAHPEEMTDELRKLCPDKSIGMVPGRPGKMGNCLVGFVYSSDTQPNDRILGTVVDNPQDWKDSPIVTVVELAGRFPIDDSGKPILGETTVSLDNGPTQRADQPVTCKIPPSGTTKVSVGIPGNPAPVAEKPVVCKGTGTTPVKPPPDFQTPPVCVTGSVQTIDGPFTGDPKLTNVSVNGENAQVITQTPRSCNYTLPEATQPGPATTTCQVDGRTYSAQTAAVGLVLSARKTNLKRGESTDFSAKVLRLDSIAASCWETPYAAERIGRLLLSAAVPGMELPEGQQGRLLLVIENRSPEVISIDGERAGRIVLTIDRSNIKDGAYEFKGKIHSKLPGGFNIRVSIIPLMAPAHLQPTARK